MNNKSTDADFRNHKFNSVNTSTHSKGLRKQKIYSPDVNNRNMHSPKLFPPPKVIDRKVNISDDASNTNKSINKERNSKHSAAKSGNESDFKTKKKQKRKSLNDFYRKYDNTLNPGGKSSARAFLSESHHSFNEETLFNNEEETDKDQKNTEMEAITKDKSSFYDIANQIKFKSMQNESAENKDELKIEGSRKTKDDEKKKEESSSKSFITEMKKDHYMEDPSVTETSRKNKKACNKKTNAKQQFGENVKKEVKPEEPSNNGKNTDLSLSMDIPLHLPVKKNTKKLVKLPVLLANAAFEIDISQSIPFKYPIENISNMDWYIESVVTRVPLPSNAVFFKGVLIADIAYVNEQDQKIHTRKVSIPWDKVVYVDWITPPELGSEFQNEYTFHSNIQEGSTHHEVSQTFTEKIEDNLRSIHFSWHNDLIGQSISSQVTVQGTAALSIDLLQQQYMYV